MILYELIRWKRLFELVLPKSKCNNPANIYLFKVNNRNTIKRCEICSELTIKTTERRREEHEHVDHFN